MVRAVLLGLLAVSCGLGASACRSHDGAPHVAPGTAVGTVLAVEGVATATRDGTQRALAVGDRVSPDDLIAASAEGSVVVQLAHNHALLELNRGATSRVDASAAWHLTAAQVAADPRQHASVAAGRNGERTAADSRSTAIGSSPGASATAAATATATAGGDPAPRDPVAAATEPDSDAKHATQRRQRADIVPQRPDVAPRRPEPAAALPPPPPPPPPTTERATEAKGMTEVRDQPIDAVGGGGVTGSVAPVVGPTGGSVAPPGGAGRVSAVLHAHDAALRTCLPAKTTVKLVVVVAAAGVQVRFAGTTAAAGAAVLACLTKQIQALTFAGAAATVQLDVSR